MRRMTLFLCVLLFLVPLATSRAQSDPPPYLYYYSDRLNAFVIERADGADSRLFGENMMPPETNTVQGPGWSPSGQWFAWSSATDLSDQYDSASQPHALSADGTRRVTALDAYPHAWLDWAPHADLLLVAGQDYHASSDPVTSGHILMLYASLIDPETDAVLVSLSWSVPCEVSGVIAYPQFSSGWSSDGQHAILQHYEPLGTWSASPRPVVFHVIGLDGSTVERRIDQPVLYWGPGAEYVTTAERTTLAVENLVTGERELFENAPAQISRLEWREDGRYALIFAPACPGDQTAAGCGIDLWLLDRNEGQFSLIYPQVGFENLVYPVESPWSPGGTYAVFLAEDGSFYRVDLAKKQAERLTPPLDDLTNLLHLSWLGWHWMDDSHIVLPGLSVGGGKQEVHFYDLSTGTHDTYEIPYYCCLGYFTIPHVSASGRYAAYLQEGAVLVDTVTGEAQNLPPDSRSYSSSNAGGEVQWHPSADWLIMASGTTFRWISVAHASGSVRRELTSCWINSFCIDWLPPQVDPASLAPGHDPVPAPEPAQILHDTHWAWYLSWSPDSSHLLAGRAPFESHDDYRGGPGVSTLWDVAQGRADGTYPLVDWNEEITWTNANGIGYIPQFKTLNGSYGSDYLAVSPDGSQRVTWLGVEDAATGAMLLAFDSGFALAPYGGGGYPATVSYSTDGRWLAAPLQRSSDLCIRIWDTATWAVLGTIPGSFQAVAFSPDGRWLAASQSWTITIWEVSTLIEQSAQ